MSDMTVDALRCISREYRAAKQNADTVVSSAMLDIYRRLTGKEPSDRFREKIRDAVEFHG